MQHGAAGRETGVLAEGGGGDSISVRVLAGAARSEDAGGSHGDSRSERAGGRGVSGEAPQGGESFLSWTRRSPGTRAGEAADERLRVDDHVRDGVGEECEQDAEEIARVFAGRVAGRSRDLDLASGDDDARGPGCKGAQGDWHYRWHGADLGGDRGRGRYSGRFGVRPGCDMRTSSPRMCADEALFRNYSSGATDSAIHSK